MSNPKRKTVHELPLNQQWREHFSVDAGDTIQMTCGHNPKTMQHIIRRCMARRPFATRINIRTVYQVLYTEVE